MKNLFFVLSCALLASPAFASVKYADGKLTINVSGGSADEWGERGGSAGSVNLYLSYVDEAKTIVMARGTEAGRDFSKTAPIAEFRSIQVNAVGGNGANGYDGRRGRDGRDGLDGMRGSNGGGGCPPADGGDGSNGTDGTDGGQGGDGQDGGRGGNGGNVHVITSPDQSELMAMVAIDVSSGGGGAGGWGGSGGSGGRGGKGGEGGSGGRNTCKDENGNSTGWDGRDGSRGSDGRDGWSGSSGYSGSSGGAGSVGSWSFDLSSPDGTQNYKDRMDLQIAGSTFTDDNEDGILEPGESFYLTSLTLVNNGPMPSPAGQTVKFSFRSSDSVISPTELTANFSEIAPKAQQTLTFKKGAMPLQILDQEKLVGKKATLTAIIGVNQVNYKPRAVDTGMAIGWPVVLTSKSTKLSVPFDSASSPLSYTIKNVGSRAYGQGEEIPVAVEWKSKTIPASDVSITLADGRNFNLAKPVYLADIAVPAKGKGDFTISLTVANSLAQKKGAGTLDVSLRMRDFDSGNFDILQTITTNVTITKGKNQQLFILSYE